MCGIAALVAPLPGPEREALVRAMCDLMAHRGPDDHGLYSHDGPQGGGVTLGHRRLSIIDLSPDGHQPMRRGRLWAAYNGEVYNYLELRQALAARGEAFRTGSDTEVMLSAFAVHGDDAPLHLNGMFAVLLYDEARRRLLLTRDRFGVKPLYYLHQGQVFAAASEPKALLFVARRLGIPIGVNDAALSCYLADAGTEQEDRTFFDRVRRVQPGEQLALDLTRVDSAPARRFYYQLTPERCPPADAPPERASVRDADAGARSPADEAFLALFTDAIKLRFRSDVRVGTCLSGGLDSSALVCVAAERLGLRPETFSAVYGANDPADESRYMALVAGRVGAQNHQVDPGAEFTPEALLRFVALHDEPIGGTSVWAQHCVFRLARQHGVTVMLDGQGADEVLTGYHGAFRPLWADLLWGGALRRFFREAQAARTLHGYGARHWPGIAWALLTGRGRGLPLHSALWPRYLERKWRDYFSPGRVPAFRVDAPPLPAELPQTAVWARRSLLHAYLYQLTFGSSLQTILRFEDRNSMAASIEARAPFLDYRLVEHCFAQPPERLLQEGFTKALLRRSLRGILPEEVRLRVDKVGFATPEPRWLAGPLRPFVEDLLHADEGRALEQRGWYRVPALRQALARLVEGRGGPAARGTGSSAESDALWKLLNVELWRKSFGI